MKKILLAALIGAIAVSAFSQSSPENTLLWRVSGKDLSQPSYLFGTIHLLCANDLDLSDSLKAAIRKTDRVYLELDMDNMVEMMNAIQRMKMRNDTTLEDLLSAEDYQKVRSYFSKKVNVLPFSVLETYKPMLAASMVMQGSFNCERTISMEQLIMRETRRARKEVKGLETMDYQLSIFDSIPYKMQAEQLAAFVKDTASDKKVNNEYLEMAAAYRNQDLNKLEGLISNDEFGVDRFRDILLYNRNVTWVGKMQQIFSNGSAIIAVGAGHLPGEKGVINLLRKAGYKVEPVPNKMSGKNQRII